MRGIAHGAEAGGVLQSRYHAATMGRLLVWLQSLFRGPEPVTETPRAVRLATPADRRAFPRMKLDLSVKLQFASVDDVVDSRTVDISRGGVFLRMAQPRPEGTKVKLDIEVAGQPYTMNGVVVRTVRSDEGGGPPGIGVLFTDTSEEKSFFIEQVMGLHDSED
jgi:uncharacterized protein (TIGR02266 family)